MVSPASMEDHLRGVTYIGDWCLDHHSSSAITPLRHIIPVAARPYSTAYLADHSTSSRPSSYSFDSHAAAQNVFYARGLRRASGHLRIATGITNATFLLRDTLVARPRCPAPTIQDHHMAGRHLLHMEEDMVRPKAAIRRRRAITRKLHPLNLTRTDLCAFRSALDETLTGLANRPPQQGYSGYPPPAPPSPQPPYYGHPSPQPPQYPPYQPVSPGMSTSCIELSLIPEMSLASSDAISGLCAAPSRSSSASWPSAAASNAGVRSSAGTGASESAAGV